MAFWNLITGNQAKATIDSVGGVVGATANLTKEVGILLDEVFTSDEERNKHMESILKIQTALVTLKQTQIHELNMANAQDTSFWNSGWRPAIGWSGALGAFLYFCPQYFMGSIVWVYACWISIGQWSESTISSTMPMLPSYPVSDAGLWQLITLLLGSAVVRQVSKNNMTARG